MNKKVISGADVEIEPGPNGTEFKIGENTVKVDNSGNLIGAEAFGNVIEKVAGGMKITRPDGSVMTMHETGGMSIENFTAKSVGVKNLADIVSYVVREEGHVRIHRIDFINDSHVEVSYALDGSVMGLSGYNLTQNINKEGEILCSPGNSKSGSEHK